MFQIIDTFSAELGERISDVTVSLGGTGMRTCSILKARCAVAFVAFFIGGFSICKICVS